MNLLKKELSDQIPKVQNEIKSLIDQKGSEKISEVTVAQAYSGLRGIKAFVCDTSSVSADKGLIIRGMPLLEITHISPEEVFFLLLTSRLPDETEINDLKKEFSKHLSVPDYVWNVLNEMPKNSHQNVDKNSGHVLFKRVKMLENNGKLGRQTHAHPESCPKTVGEIAERLPNDPLEAPPR